MARRKDRVSEKELAGIWRSEARWLLWMEEELPKTGLVIETSPASQIRIDRAYKTFPSESEREQAVAKYRKILREAEERDSQS